VRHAAADVRVPKGNQALAKSLQVDTAVGIGVKSGVDVKRKASLPKEGPEQKEGRIKTDDEPGQERKARPGGRLLAGFTRLKIITRIIIKKIRSVTAPTGQEPEETGFLRMSGMVPAVQRSEGCMRR